MINDKTNAPVAVPDEREEFERQAISEGWAYQDHQYGIVFWDHLPKVISWKSWQARAALSAPQAAPQGPMAETVEDAAHDVAKWLNERPNRPLDLRHVAMLAAHAQAAPQPAAWPISPDVAADLERSDWTPEEALRWYAAGKHYDTVPNGDGTRSARILDNGAVASNALKSMSHEYAERKGDVALLESQPAAPAVDARDAEVAKLTKACAELSSMFHDQIVAQQAAWIEWKHGGGAEAGMQWIENGLDGPGHIPDEDEPYGKEAQAWFDANKSDPFPACPCGRPSNILWMGHGFCCNAHYDEFRVAQAAAKEGGAA